MNIYIVFLTSVEGHTFYMPYFFTSEKKAYLYGEYKYRTSENIKSYMVEKLINFNKDRFYLLK